MLMLPRDSNNRALDHKPMNKWLADEFNKNTPLSKIVFDLLTSTGSQEQNGAVTYAFHGDVRPGAAALVGLPAVIGVLAGTAFQQRVPVHRLAYGFALLLAAVGARLLL